MFLAVMSIGLSKTHGALIGENMDYLRFVQTEKESQKNLVLAKLILQSCGHLFEGK